MPVISELWDAEVGRSLEVWSLRPSLANMRQFLPVGQAGLELPTSEWTECLLRVAGGAGFFSQCCEVQGQSVAGAEQRRTAQSPGGDRGRVLIPSLCQKAPAVLTTTKD
ncbi:hypothetical protein AAY473_027715 [Plecturocebus cupreus]